MNKEKIVIFGTGDIAQIANYYFDIDSNYQVVAFTVDKSYCIASSYEGKPLVPFEDLALLYPPSDYKLFVALSYAQMNKLREAKYTEAKSKGYNLVSYISSKCTYLSQFECGDNCFIFEDNTIQPFVKIANNVTLWSGNHIGHHSVLESHNFISSHVVISGHCIVESNCFIGVNATIGHQVKLATETLVGAGSVITKDTDNKSVHVPAKSVVLNKTSDMFNL
jgi:sugar O-acyltransferase (sialic acid O-acetyltransferase NeuD family)